MIDMDCIAGLVRNRRQPAQLKKHNKTKPERKAERKAKLR